ncbi:Mitochondrial import protein Zim17 [Rasamsonia emersonii CBS 393.64]|uniref:Mitochondrial import protein Zim17 n=1 Tax=Rasamsonia emersonii (strain ATCC 16479 / CBS 393.64 / IMI 116815) TaxID=1408163 RepID=A0A0F4YYC8_RASE3|nr:Mitochondrial import protein Zim17 [Rasamsonia emersonii CBS 393.64]KKA23115.1 Mitochondrial import protein Zim17 [Rasamsonia emersonii CBS 393.64]
MRSSATLLRSLRGPSRLLPRTPAVRTTPLPIQSPLSPIRPSRPSTNIFAASRRYQSSSSDSGSTPLTDSVPSAETDAANAEQNAARRSQEPAYRITFTCKPCGHRSSHQMSKHGYHKGTVLIRCPNCLNRHVISDHLGIFMDQKSTLEDILKRKGMTLTKGYLEGDMEFWEDGLVYKTGTGDQLPEASEKSSS